MEWNDATIATLRKLWDSGISCKAIADEMRCGKNAVVGKAHRLHLPPRPSPIVHIAAGAPRRRPGVERHKTAAPLVAPLLSIAAPPPPAPPPPVAVRVVPTVVRTTAHELPCCWPIGHPGTKTFRFCEAAAPSGRYCAQHTALAYIQPRKTGEEIAR